MPSSGWDSPADWQLYWASSRGDVVRQHAATWPRHKTALDAAASGTLRVAASVHALRGPDDSCGVFESSMSLTSSLCALPIVDVITL